jgi:hypothetical protein
MTGEHRLQEELEHLGNWPGSDCSRFMGLPAARIPVCKRSVAFIILLLLGGRGGPFPGSGMLMKYWELVAFRRDITVCITYS